MNVSDYIEDDENEEGEEGGDDEEEGGDDEEEEEEEEEEEPEDPKPALVERFFSIEPGLTLDAKNRLCPNEKHHFDACAARVAKAQEEAEKGEHHGHAEDCAEEFLHLMHCVDKHIAVPLFKQLK